MQWSAEDGAGFTRGTPWLPIAADAHAVNVAAQRRDPRSMLALYRRLIALRRANPALATGRFTSIAAEGDVLAYLRRDEDDSRSAFLVALNMGSRAQALMCPPSAFHGRVALSTHLDRDDEAIQGAIELRPDEGVVVRLAASGLQRKA